MSRYRPPTRFQRLQQWYERQRGLIGAVALVVGIVVWAHSASGQPVFTSSVKEEPGWAAFSRDLGVEEFGADGYFVRAVQHGYNLFYHTDRYAWRFTRKGAQDANNSCASCHPIEQLGYAFVNADREDPELGRRVSFEEQVMRCYAGQMNGFVPTIYDPAIRDLRILARMVARHLNLSEGALNGET